MICAYGFLAILCDFLIFAYQILGRDCEIFNNRGAVLPHGAFCGHAVAAILRGLVGFFGRWYIRIRPGVARLYGGPIWGLQGTKEKPPAKAGGGVFWFICCGWAFGIVLYPQDNGLRVFQRCGRAFSSGLVRLRRRLTARPTRHFWRQCGGRGRLFQ